MTRLLIFTFFLFPLGVWSQVVDTRRLVNFDTSKDTVQLDSLSINPESFVVVRKNGKPFPKSVYKLDFDKAQLIFIRSKFKEENLFTITPLVASFRVFPINFSKPLYHKDASSLKRNREGEFNPFNFTYDEKSKTDDFFSMQGLNKNGSISRGITVGNTQDVVVNSSLNLQLSGKISENIELLAAITDNNVPVQPDGNTQQLQDFDQVYIQLFEGTKWKVIAGDFQLQKPNTYFMSFYKRAQGLSVSSVLDLRKPEKKKEGNPPLQLMLTGSGAISRGKFKRQLIQGIEGNQGPYQLTGNDGEIYIIVLAGTERVFIDGQQLTRGQSNDYIIDYNTASIKFTPKNLITKDRRIIVEFQYSDKNYSRTLLHVGSELQAGKWKARVNFYNEQDAKNQPLQQELNTEAKELMSQIGDSIQLALVPSADSVAFSNSEVLYRQSDTTVTYLNGASVSAQVYVYSSDSTVAKYRLRFTDVGLGNGDYLQQTSTSANGRVFYWIAPDSLGNRQGRFAAVQLLVTPKQTQMLDVGVDYAISKNSGLSVEAAMSNVDPNTFSTIDNRDNTGFAGKLVYHHDFPLGKKDSATIVLKTGANFEYTGEQFRPIERFRTVEFERDWNLLNVKTYQNQYISGVKLGADIRKWGEALYQFKNFINEDVFKAYQHLASANLDKLGFHLDFKASFIQSDGLLVNNQFNRYIGTLSKQFKWIALGIRDELEDNRFRKPGLDSLNATSYYFNDRTFFITSPDSAKNRFGISYRRRMDKRPRGSELVPADLSHNISLSVDLNSNPNHNFKLTSTFRRLAILDSALSRTDTLVKSQKYFDNLVNRIEYSWRVLKGVIQSSTFFEVGSGLELQRQYQYSKVTAGLGQYVWRDYNQDGIQQLDEFPVAVFPNEAEYIRVSVPSNTYSKTYSNQFNQTFNITPSIVWSTKKGFRKFVSRFNTQTIFSTDRKTGQEDFWSSLNPFRGNVLDSSLRSINSSFRNTLFFNRSSSKFGMDYSFQSVSNKTLLVNGFESRSTSFHQLGSRWNFTRRFTLNMSYKDGRKVNKQQFLQTNSYDLHYFELEPKLTWQPGAAFRWSVNFRYSQKRNRSELAEAAFVRNIGTELKFNMVSKGSFNMQFNYLNISFNGSKNSNLGYEMLEALQPGLNFTWAAGWQTNIGKNMQFNLTYNGRKSEGAKAIHSGNMQVRAYF
ncbi:MAG: hypothetical protein K1X82_11280 [Bacteroidia bacterium]|nr:hypothetical protein [Bacteroidia bacterium]